MPKESIEVAGKTFKYTEGEESELDALAQAAAHLRDLRDKAMKRIRPAAGSERATARTYDTNVVLTPGPAKLTGKGN